MISNTHVHIPLLNHLRDAVSRRSFYDGPKLGWITENYLDGEYLHHLIDIAPAYGVEVLVLGDEYFEWARNPKIAVKNWLAGMASEFHDNGLKLGVLVNDMEERQRLEREVLHLWQKPIYVYGRDDVHILDGIASRFGAGRLPYLALAPLVKTENENKICIRMDHPGVRGEDLGSWGNVFGISYHLLTGTCGPEEIETEYFRFCFGPPAPEVQKIFGFARQAVEKSFLVHGSMNLMENGCWPERLEWLDRQLTFDITRDLLSQIDLEKIEALEAVHDAWKILDAVRPQLAPEVFLWLEHYFQRLKVVCLALRLLAETYFAIRGRTRGTVKLPDHVLWSKYRDFAAMVREHQALLAEFDRHSRNGGADPLQNLILELRPHLP